jgi:hypothetical protein
MTFTGKVVRMMPSKGINESAGEQNIADDECVAAQNVWVYRGDLFQRGGFARHVNMPVDGTQYTTGTVTVTNGSATVTGAGTTFTSAMVGGGIIITGDTASYKITAFNSTTSITISPVYAGSTAAGASYTIRHTGSAVTGLFQAEFGNAAQRIIAAAGTALKRPANGDWTSVKGALTFTSGANNLFSWAVLNDLIIGSNGVDQLFKVSDATDPAVVLGGTPPSYAKCILAFQNRILAGNVTNAAGKGKVQWCVINNPDNWTGAGSGNATPRLSGGQEITGMGAAGDEAFLFYDASIYRIVATGDGNSPFAFPDHELAIGCVSPQSVVSVEDRGLLFFAGQRGIYKMEAPSYRPIRISKRIDVTWDGLNKARLPQIVGTRIPNFNAVAFSVTEGAGTTHAKVLVYDFDRDAWTTFVGMAVNCWAVIKDSVDDQQVLFGNYSGIAQLIESGTDDDGTAITAFVTSKSYPTVDGYRRGRVPFAVLYVDGQSTGSSLQFNHGFDLTGINYFDTISQETGGAEYDDAVFDEDLFASEGQLSKRLVINGFGHHFQWQIKNELEDNTFRLYGVDLGVKAEGRSA